MGEARKDSLRVDFDRLVKLECHGSTISSDGGLLAYRQLDEAFGLTLMADEGLTDLRRLMWSKDLSAVCSCP